MNLRKMLVRMLALWLLVSALIAAWAWMNVVLVGTSPWMDAAFGSIVILILTRWTADLAVGIARRSVGRRVGWLYLLLTALTGMLWARLPFLDELANRFLSPLFILRRLIIAVLVAPVLQLRSTYQAGAEMSLPVLAPLALGCLVFGLVALATAIAGRVAWTSIQPILSPGIDAVQTRFPRLMIRPSRWWAGANLLLITTLVLSFVMSGLAIADNANAPIVNWQAVATGPSVPPTVMALALDGRNGTLYAGTDGGGVFRSSDGGASWQTASAGLSNSNVYALALDGQDGTLYAGTNGGGVFRSSDGGASWQTVSAGLSNTTVRVLVLDGRNGTLYAGSDGGGVFRSSDGGASWQAASAELSNSSVLALVLDGQDETLYAGTFGGGVFRSSDGGASWQAASAGLSNSFVRALVLDGQDGTLYAGTYRGGVFRSSDGGASWQAASVGLSNSNVVVLAQDGRDGTLYAGTEGGGVFRSSDGGASWQAASAGLSNSHVYALDGRDGALYAGTNSGGVFRSSDGGASWQAAIAGLSNSPVLALALDGRDGTLYAGILGGGVFRSSDGGASWQAASAGLSNSNVWGLALDGRDGTLYAGTFGGGVFRSSDEGASWQAASAGLSDSNVWALALDEQSGTLYASTDGGIFRSPGGKANWGGANFGLPSNSVRSLAKDEGDGTLYAATDSSTFHSTDGGASWQQVPFTLSLRQVLNSFSTERSYGVVCRGSGNDLVWAAVGGGNWWARLAGSTRLRQATIRRRLPEDNIEVLAAWGNTIGQAQMRSGATFTQVPAQPRYHRIPLAWLAVRALVWKATLWVSTYYRWVLAALGLAIVVLLISTYTNLARPFGIPLWATILARRRLDTYARPDKLDAAWQDWEQAVRAELLHFGDAMTVDLRRVPGPFRQYALRRYAQTYDAIQTLESRSGYVRLLTGDRLRNWFVAWTVAGRAMGKRAGLAPAGSVAVDKLAAAIADALGLTLGPARDFEAVRAYEVEAPALRLNIPPRFPLVFVADPQPSASTVQMLVDAVDVLKETGYFALVVPLESPVRQVDAAAELRQVVDRSAHVQDFIVLSQNDVLDILIARHAAKPLVERVLAQVDLSVVSPFVVSGPVPETMFFGREAEVKTLVEKAGVADYAIIGNRKIGKTSLLKRARTRLAASGQIKPLMVDCQTVRDAAGFFAAFQAQTGIKLLSATPEGFTAVLKDLRQDTPLMLMMDEVDALLTDEQARGEPLAAAWRALAQAGVCRFVFCGSTGLARRLDDPHSVFFNFPQPMPLGYLAPETARLVLTQPLETLGIVLEDEEKLLSEVLALTSGHPNFIQYLGRGLVDAANRRKERRIMLADLVDLRASTDFSEYFLKTVWGEAGPLERLITLVAPPEGFGLKEIETALTAQGLQVSDEQLDTALKLLRIYAILEKHDRTYSFVPRAFPEILHRTQEVERLVAFEKRRLAEGGA